MTIVIGAVQSQPKILPKVPNTSNPDPKLGDRHFANLYLRVDKQGKTNVSFTLYPATTEPVAVQQAISKVLGCSLQKINQFNETDTDIDQEITPERLTSNAAKYLSLSAECNTVFSRSGLLTQGDLKPEPLLQFLKPLQVKSLNISLSHPISPYAQATENIPPRPKSASTSKLLSYLSGWHSYQLEVGKSYPPIHLEFGYRYEDVLLLIIAAIAIISIPAGIVLWMRKTALHKQDTDATAAWFGYTRGLSWVILGVWVAWVSLYSTLKFREFIDFNLSDGVNLVTREAFKFSGFIIFPIITIAVCQVLSYPVFARVRGMEWTKWDLVRQSLLTQLATFVPLGLLLISIYAALDNNIQVAIGAIVTAYISRMFLAIWASQAQDIRLNAITVGELRDRAFGLAQTAGVKLQQLYVLPAGRSQMVNAFATTGNTILLSDYLLRKLDKHEVDAIISHELGHLKHNHPKKLSQTLIGVIVGTVILGMVLRDLIPWLSSPPVFMVVSLLTFLYVSREFESEADMESVNLSGNAEGAITGLIKITRLNFTPLEWGGWQEKFITHPSTMKRVKAIAKYANIPSQRLQELIDDNTKQAEYYSLPTAIDDNEPIFSSKFKQTTVLTNWVTLLAVQFLPAVVIVWIANALPWGDIGKWGVYALGLGAIIYLYLWIGDFIAVQGYDQLEQKLRHKIQAKDINHSQTEFVSLTPNTQLRLYEGFYDWDIGLLLLTNGSLYYLGENAEFTLQTDQITSMQLTEGMPTWWHLPRIQITWFDMASSTDGSLSLWANGRGSLHQAKKSTLNLYQHLQDWQASNQLEQFPPYDYLSQLDKPNIGEVTSTALSDVFTFKTLGNGIFINILVAIAITIMLQLPLHGGLYLSFIAVFMTIFQRIPFFLQRKSL